MERNSGANGDAYHTSSPCTLNTERDFLLDDNSSTCTAGPPPDSPRRTGRFNCPWNLATTQMHDSGYNSATSSMHTHRAPNQTGSYQPVGAGSNGGSPAQRDPHKRSSSNMSASVSPASSSTPQEWGKSFRLFNTSRFLGSTCGSRRRESNHYVHRMPFSNVSNARASFEMGWNSHLSPHGKHSGLFGVSNVTHRSLTPELQRGSSTIFSFYHSFNINNSSLVSPELLRPSSTKSPFSYAHAPTGLALAQYAMGDGELLEMTLSPFQKEVPMLMLSLKSYLALNGETIIIGDGHHPLVIKRGGLIGTGGFARVFVGLNTVKGELVAIKEINIMDVDDIKALKAVEQEFALLKSLRHPNIVSYHLFEHSRSQKVCRIVMEMLAGNSTLHLLQKYGPLKETILRKLSRDLLSAISFIHKEGIFHRDIKPANILISHKGEAKLCDFGCSKRVSELSKATSCIIGTPVYMAPELIKGEADHKADIWSMACSLFELGTGLQPWYHSGVRDNLPLMFYITTTSETPLVVPTHDNFTEFSPEFMSFLDLCFTRNPEQRPEAMELLKHPWLCGSTSGSTPPVTTPRLLFDKALFTTASTDNGETDTARLIALSPPMAQHLERSPTCSGEKTRHNDSFVSHDPDVAAASASSAFTAFSLEDEILCQQELGEVAASIAVDLCCALMTPPELRARVLDRRPTDTNVEAEGNLALTRNLSKHSLLLDPRVRRNTSTGDCMSLVLSPEHSILHENFHFSHALLGASAGNFVFPNDVMEASVQQYLRIGEDGNLKFATVSCFDGDAIGEETNLTLPSTSVDSSMFTVSHNSRVISSLTGSPFGKRSVALSTGVAAGERQTSPRHHTASAAAASRGGGESPFPHLGGSHASVLSHISPPLFVMRPPPLSHCLPSNSPLLYHAPPSSDDFFSYPHSPVLSTSRCHSFRHLPEKEKLHGDGKLQMSFCVNTAPGDEISVMLDIDTKDVHCKMVDHQPNFLVVLSDDIKGQITAKIREVSRLATKSPTSSLRSCSTTPRHMESNCTISEHATRASSGAHFYSNSSRVFRPTACTLSRLSNVSASQSALMQQAGSPSGSNHIEGHATTTPHVGSPTSSSIPLAGILNSRCSPRLKSTKLKPNT